MLTVDAAVARAREVFNSGSTRPLVWRLERLANLRRMLIERRAEFAGALHRDLGKHRSESQLMEIGFVTSEAAHLEHVLKPSEHAPATSAALARWIPEYLGAAAVVEGGIPETTALLTEHFDHIFFTGGEAAAKAIMRAAAETLTPVTLELGGKCPAYVDGAADLAKAAKRIAWGRFMNAGQACVAPDHVLATPEVLAALGPLLVRAIGELFGDDPAASESYGRIVNQRHFDRLAAMADGSEIVHGGQRDAASRYFAPTILRAGRGDAVMQEEIFGPLLPLVEISGRDDAIRFINSGTKPLALYVFSPDDETRRAFADRTSSGALSYGVPAAHLLVPGLPFGGVGGSGMGAYHGEHSLRTFSHERSTLDKPLWPDTLELIYPPYNKAKDVLIRTVVAPAGKRRR